MIINLFEIFVLISDVDLKKIKLKKILFDETWLSKTQSTYKASFQKKVEDTIEKEPSIYLMNLLVKMLEEKIKFPFNITLINIWENKYENADYQEPHIHTKSDFSFIIYKKVDKDGGKTLFLNPSRNFIDPFYNISNLFEKNFLPSCKQGQIILFPSFLEHMVLKTSNQHTISGNISFKKL
jgi:hypothetical protein